MMTLINVCFEICICVIIVQGTKKGINTKSLYIDQNKDESQTIMRYSF